MVDLVANDSFLAGGEVDLTAGNGSAYGAKVAELASGGFVTVWASSQGVFVRRFDAEAAAVGVEQKIYAFGQMANAVGLRDGGYAVTWNELTQLPDGSTQSDNKVQVFGGDGEALTQPIRLEQAPFGAQVYPVLAALDTGGFVASWWEPQGTVVVRTFDAGGMPLTGEVIASQAGASGQSLATLGNGHVLVGSQGYAQGRFTFEVRDYDPSTGTIAATTFGDFASTGFNYSLASLTALASGDILVTWVESQSSRSLLRGQVYTPAGVPSGASFSVQGTVQSFDQIRSLSATALDSGGFVLAYGVTGSFGGDAVYGLAFDSEANASGSLFAVKTGATGADVAQFGSDDFAVVWSSDDRGSFVLDGGVRAYYSSTNGSAGAETIDGTGAINILRGLGGDDTLNGLGADDLLIGGAGADLLNGGAGIDTASYSDSTAAVMVDLLGNTATGGTAAGDTFVSVENLIGSAFGDSLTGDAAANRIEAGAGDDRLAGLGGADVLVGGAGIDTADYSASAAGVFVDLLPGYDPRGVALVGVGRGGDAEGDTLSEIENVTGSAFADTLVARTTSVPSMGERGSLLLGGGGDDVLVSSGAVDTLDGGEGSDTASYERSTLGVRVSLAAGQQGDVFVSIENLRGSAFNDTLTGDAAANRLGGLGGDDTLIGGAGDDRLDGGEGRDTAQFAVASGTASLRFAGDGSFQLTSTEGTDTLLSVEALRFTDRIVATTNFVAIEQAYVSLGGRDASLGELIVWTDAITAGRTIGDVRAGIINDALGASAIAGAYRQGFGRAPTGEEIAIWRAAFLNGADLNTLRDTIAQVMRTDAAIDGLYRSYGGQPATAGDLDYWRGRIAAGVTLDAVRNAIVDDQLGARGIAEDYQDFLGRAPSADEIAYWRGAFKAGTPASSLNAAILNDPQGTANANARVDRLYEDFGGRHATASDLDYWRGAIRAGANLDDVRAVIVDALSAPVIDAEYRTYMGRAAAAGEVTIWQGLFKAGTPAPALRQAILGTEAGIQHSSGVITGLYQDYFGRAPAADEIGIWLGLFRNGVTTDTLRDTLMTQPSATAGGVATFAAGAGADTIVFNTEHLVVTGFDPVWDTIDLRGSALAGSSPLAFAHDVVSLDGRHDVLIDTAEHDILLTGVTLAQLSAGDFLI